MEKNVGTQDVELIPANPHFRKYFENWGNSSIRCVYSPTQKVVVKRQRKKIKLDAAAITTPDNEPMEIV